MPGREGQGEAGRAAQIRAPWAPGEVEGAVVEDLQALAPIVMGRQTQDKPAEG